MSVAANVVYLIAGTTGGGKSTTVANIVIPLIDANKKVLIVSNEESRSHVYARIACRTLGYSFRKWTKSELHQDILDRIDSECESLAKTVTVIGTDFQGTPTWVTTPEGLEIIFNTFSKGHDAILFDYYQAISHGINDPSPNAWDHHQAKFNYFLNTFKNMFDGPVFVMSQIKTLKEKEVNSFVDRLWGRKSIGDTAMVHIEIVPDKDNYTTRFYIYKDRLWNNDGAYLTMGFDRDSGRYVNYDDQFKARAAQWIADRASIAAIADEGDEDGKVEIDQEVLSELNLDN